MTIDPSNDRAVVNGMAVPFLSKTNEEKTDSGNAKKSVL